MLITHAERPRELRWYHAGPMLYGDWGTSRFYVLGLALYYARYSSFWYVAGVCALVAAVGWAYTIVCRCYPDGGGVYSAARQTSRTLAVVGALLLFADYIVTASISAIDGMHYLQIKEMVMRLGITASADAAEVFVRGFAIFGILAIGVINYVGPRKAGTFALVVAAATLALTLALVVSVFVPHETVSAVAAGWANLHRPEGSAGHVWHNMVNVVLALSGVEAVANMTGIMVQPVGRTSKKSIWPVLVEVVVLNLVLAAAMNALPAKYISATGQDGQAITLEQKENAFRAWEKAHPGWQNSSELKDIGDQMDLTEDQKDVKNRVLWVMAKEYVGAPFAMVCGIVFGLLLLSAVNTAVADMVSIQYVMSRDTELPHGLLRLNTFGVPWRALIAAVALPSVVLLITGDLDMLAGLYAIGVVGAISINLSSCCTNREMPLKVYERAGMGIIAAILIGIELTLAAEKPSALIFALGVLGAGLAARFVNKTYLPARAKTRKERVEKEAAVSGELATQLPADVIDMSRPKILVAARGGRRLIDFAAHYAKTMNGVLMVLFVRQINVLATGAGAERASMTLEDDSDARRVFEIATEASRAEGVPMIPIYATGTDVAYTILDFAATYNASALLMGVSRQGALLRALKGDVLSAVADHLPVDIPLLIHA